MKPPTEGNSWKLGRVKTQPQQQRGPGWVRRAECLRSCEVAQGTGKAADAGLCSLFATASAKEPWLLQLRLEQTQLWGRIGCREEGAFWAAQTKRRLQYPIFLLPSTLVRTNEKVSLRKSKQGPDLHWVLKQEGGRHQGGWAGRGGPRELLSDPESNHNSGQFM